MTRTSVGEEMLPSSCFCHVICTQAVEGRMSQLQFINRFIYVDDFKRASVVD